MLFKSTAERIKSLIVCAFSILPLYQELEPVSTYFKFSQHSAQRGTGNVSPSRLGSCFPWYTVAVAVAVWILIKYAVRTAFTPLMA